jgi:catechol 2,3-dioxygenase-like lactoylglutathione lyase family enzyme
MSKQETIGEPGSPLSWPPELPVVQVRVARPTNQLENVVRFYRDGLGLPQIASFSGHRGYTGVMLGLPGQAYHLEFTQHEAGGNDDCRAPTRDNLLVLYMPDAAAVQRLVARLEGLGYPAVPPENPYWADHGATFEDPDGWRVVLMNAPGL